MADPITQIIEDIAKQWDGCEYDAPGGLIEIGDAIRRAGLPMVAAARTLQAAEQLAEALTVPAGHKVAPLEPTPEMCRAGSKYGEGAAQTYKAMLAAATTQAEQPAQQAVRMLTDEESKSCMEWTLLPSEVEAIQRRFCEVNGIALPPAAEGEKKQ